MFENNIQEAAFYDELEKCGFISGSALRGLGAKVTKAPAAARASKLTGGASVHPARARTVIPGRTKFAAANFAKTAKKKGEPDHYPGWWKSQKGMSRAMRESDKGVGKILAKDELIGQRVKGQMKGSIKGLGYGAAGGGLAGLLASAATKGKIKPHVGGALGALGGAGLGSSIGASAGAMKADKDFLRKRGIKTRWGGLAGAKFSPEARKKYLSKYKD